MKIVIVDYGMGNIHSIKSTLRYIGIEEISLTSDFETLNNADKIILPGVGSFGKAMLQIKERKLDKLLSNLALEKKKPILGICLGMQLLGVSSTEGGLNSGLSFVDAKVVKFDNANLKVPHVGINQVKTNLNNKIYSGFADSPDFYFTHSYKMVSNIDINQGICNYGEDFVASFEVGNIVGVQFHPELSQTNGIKLLRNFVDLF